jgi:hypothetical protein
MGNIMKIKDDFILREIAGTWLAVPIGSRVVDFNGMITLSETGAFLWKLLETEKSVRELVDAMTEKYEVDEETAGRDIAGFLDLLEEKGLTV